MASAGNRLSDCGFVVASRDSATTAGIDNGPSPLDRPVIAALDRGARVNALLRNHARLRRTRTVVVDDRRVKCLIRAHDTDAVVCGRTPKSRLKPAGPVRGVEVRLLFRAPNLRVCEQTKLDLIDDENGPLTEGSSCSQYRCRNGNSPGQAGALGERRGGPPSCWASGCTRCCG